MSHIKLAVLFALRNWPCSLIGESTQIIPSYRSSICCCYRSRCTIGKDSLRVRRCSLWTTPLCTAPAASGPCTHIVHDRENQAVALHRGEELATRGSVSSPCRDMKLLVRPIQERFVHRVTPTRLDERLPRVIFSERVFRCLPRVCRPSCRSRAIPHRCARKALSPAPVPRWRYRSS